VAWPAERERGEWTGTSEGDSADDGRVTSAETSSSCIAPACSLLCTGINGKSLALAGRGGSYWEMGRAMRLASQTSSFS